MTGRVQWLRGMMFGGFVLAMSGSASASLITVQFGSLGNNANDCAGVFSGDGSTFPRSVPCNVGFGLNPQIAISPIVVKKEFSGTSVTKTEKNSNFGTIDGDEFMVAFNPNTWTYTPGAGDPQIRYWVAKGGNEGFNLF